MTPYRLPEADIQIPEEWADQSINIFKVPAKGKAKEASFIVSRDSSQGDLSFPDYVTKQIETARSQLPGFDLKQRKDFAIDNAATALIDYTWKKDGRELMLRQVFVERKPAVVITTFTTTPEDAPHHEAQWMAVMGTFKPL